MNNRFPTKEEYINIVKNELSQLQQTLMISQINEFYKLQNVNLKKTSYKIGESVNLKKNTFIHGLHHLKSLDIFESIMQNGLISNTFRSDNKKWKVNYCVSLWHIKKAISLREYVLLYSGFTVRHNLGENIQIPYGKFDEYLASLKLKDFKSIIAESSMECTFLPNLAKDIKELQYALIISGEDKRCQPLLKNNLLASSFDQNTALLFMNIKNSSRVIDEKHKNEYNRISYILFGLPSSMIEGILVGRKAEKDISSLKKIKQIFPESYICNLDGVVIL